MSPRRKFNFPNRVETHRHRRRHRRHRHTFNRQEITVEMLEIVDLTRSFEEPSQQQQHNSSNVDLIPPYQPRTLSLNSRRYEILPAYPTSTHHTETPLLLLANVPVNRLNSEERRRRQSGAFPAIYTVNAGQLATIPSYFQIYYYSLMSSLIQKYNVDIAILDYNLYRFTECYRIFTQELIRRHQYSTDHFELTDLQKQYAFEFYLQIDVDMFFMKTCSFRNAQLRSPGNEYLFCIDEPSVRYTFTACHHCSLCIPRYDNTRRQHSVIRFDQYQVYRFNNGYETILNCPANCQTRNLIYVLTCPCIQFEYIGETSQRLEDRLFYHRMHTNRILHEFLIGENNVARTRNGVKDYETLVKDRMLLYRHTARCPASMQIFLNYNTIYWSFVPITEDEAILQNEYYDIPSSLVIHDPRIPTGIASKYRRDVRETDEKRSDEQTRSCIRAIPPCPPGYTFSISQRIKQFQYFKDKKDISTEPYTDVDLHSATVIAVLPENASAPVREFVESLFITHTETKLNISNRLLHQNDEYHNTSSIRIPVVSTDEKIQNRGLWCCGLIRRY